MTFSNKVVIVTGGGRDIGRAVTLGLVEAGARVLFTWCGSEDAAMATLADAQKIAPGTQAFQADLTQGGQADAVVAAAIAAFGGTIDSLVNVTGGIVARKTLADMDTDFFDHVMTLNATSTFAMTKAVVPHMAAGSSIVNVASQAGRDGGGGGASAYATAKGAVMAFTRAMAKELGPQNIRVNALCPGMISTTFHDVFTSDEIRAKVAGATPLRREGSAAEVADAVLYLASERASFITGACVDINGGTYFS